jgi:hypothetical protein
MESPLRRMHVIVEEPLCYNRSQKPTNSDIMTLPPESKQTSSKTAWRDREIEQHDDEPGC